MKFALLVAFASLSVTASSAFPAACGPNADILSESSFGHEGAEVKLATISCPGSDVRGRSSLVNASKRQVVTQCDTVAHPCIEVDCDFRPEQPLLPDCIALTTALNGLVFAGLLLAPWAARQLRAVLPRRPACRRHLLFSRSSWKRLALRSSGIL
ncbi:hypothetical protein B0H13DRAFT_2262571 [Mycena leptocephala]|nr:hypothetical protein B0H13DRAFT_2262571 [Mycena leptocephala]